LIAGRKLLLADDSIAIQKVVDLTFTDEGMEVTTVGSGQDALDKLNHLMPGIDGYELCKYIKQNERFRDIPVVLLIGSFEPFNEADAKNAGADDIVTKPFQSIRNLVNRVGLLLGGTRDDSETVDHEAVAHQPDADYRRQELDRSQRVSADYPNYNQQAAVSSQSDADYRRRELDRSPQVSADYNQQAAVGSQQESGAYARYEQGAEPGNSEAAFSYQASALSEEQQNVRVFVEAPMMPEPEEVAAEHSCPPAIELQTADTQKLDMLKQGQIDDSVKVEVAPAMGASTEEGTSASREHMTYQVTQTEPTQSFDDGVLDLGDVDDFVSAQAEDDFVLDVDVEPAPAATVWERVTDEPFEPVKSSDPFMTPPVEAMSHSATADTHEWAAPVTSRMEDHAPFMEPKVSPLEVAPVAEPANEVNSANLSPEMIEAISRRVVEQLSENVIREIAWEVVPELSEILIKKKLEETR
jgi:CheY-like chemotaxis protein